MRPATILPAVLVALAAFSQAQAADSHANALFSADGLVPHGVQAEPARYKGFDGLHVTVTPEHKSLAEGGPCDNCTFLEVPGIDFGDGVIEVEVAGDATPGAPRWARGFVGTVFRVSDDASKYEGIYLRPLNAIVDAQVARNRTVQYFSYPDHPWKVLREQSPGAYEAYADVQPGEWTRLRIEVRGVSARLFVNGQKTPSLVVTDMKHGAELRGTVGLFTEPKQDAYFRNLVVTGW